MRTTISLDDQLLRLIKRTAAERGVSVSEVIRDAVRAHLAATPARARRRFKLVTFHGEGPRRGIDLDRTSEVLEAEDIERYGSRRASR